MRDGRDVVNSLMKMPWRPEGLINNARFWKKFVKHRTQMHNHLIQESKQDLWLDINYEQLLEHPEVSLKAICDFTNINYDTAMLNSEINLDKQIYAEWESKWKHKAKLDFDLTRVGAYKKELSQDDQITLSWFLEKELKSLGYEVNTDNLSFKHLGYALKGYWDLFIQKILNFIREL